MAAPFTPEEIHGLSGKTVLGVNPPVHDFAWFDLWAKPAGLLRLLGHLRSRGNQVFLLDCLHEARIAPLTHGRWKVRRELVEKPAPYRHIPRRYYRFGLSPEDLRARAETFPRPEVILVTSVMTYWYPGVFEAIALMREIFPGVPVGLGGLYAALCPDHARQSGADFFLTGGPPLPPTPIPLDVYDQPGYGILTTAHGCPRRCAYCASAILEPRFRPRPVGEIVADLDHQAALGLTDLAFYDDALLWEPENRFYPLAAHIRKRHPDLRLHTPNGLGVAQIDEQCAEILYQSGFHTLRLSLEGLDARTRAAGADKAGAETYARAVRNLLRAGYAPERLETYLLVGLPGQSPADIERSIRFVRSEGGRPKLSEFSPIPGTRLYAEALAATPEIAAEPLWHNNTVYAPYLARIFPADELQRLKTLCREA